VKKALWFILKFLAVSLPLTWLWWSGGKATYGQCFREVSAPFYTLFGLEGMPAPARERYVHMIPFIALMLATPALTLKRRFGVMGLGLVLTFVVQLVANAIAVSMGGKWGPLPPPVAAVSDALPFTLWVLNARSLLPERNVVAPTEGTDSSSEPERDEATDP
jgi:hypothetical protein